MDVFSKLQLWFLLTVYPHEHFSKFETNFSGALSFYLHSENIMTGWITKEQAPRYIHRIPCNIVQVN